MKTKEQKQKEALARNRAAMPQKIAEWCESQPGGKRYKAAMVHGKDHAQKIASQAEIGLLRAAKEAQTDRHGNPLENLTKWITK